ncbi:MAG: hypothetical protein M9963_07460 [Kiritimatiellae bacterium]|nr:hypothetical protein [Kiritimatiellia bacterium]MCO5061828.1 hypothetical protein [Kiritimatiellia bacterium]MCO6400444.1 hypothetical protein [Verrucomicrobiota bacterium]
MKTADEILSDLQALDADNYYSEDFEWLSAVRAYRAGLSEGEGQFFREAVLRRLLMDGSITDVLLCSVDAIPEAATLLANKLNGESAPSQMTRALIEALRRCGGEEAFRAVARFVDSDQEGEALRALAAIHFVRALPFLARAMKKEYIRDLALHILHDRFRAVGMDALQRELLAFCAGWSDAELSERFCRALKCKDEPYNPFTVEEIATLTRALLGPSFY